MTITSPHNPHLKDLRRLARRRERERTGRFAAEGEDLILAAEHAGWPALEGYRVPGCEVGEAHFNISTNVPIIRQAHLSRAFA